MLSWSLDTPPPQDAAARAVGGLIHALGRPGFATDALCELHAATGVGSWAVYQVGADRAPVMHLSAALGGADTPQRCFATYCDSGLHARDRSFEPVRQAPARQPLLLRLRAEDAAPAHRDAIYLANGMVERLSVARTEADGSVLAVNVYRHLDRGGFDGASVETFARLAAPLLAAVSRQIGWAAEQAPPPDRRAALRCHCPALTERELDVLERLLKGMTYDGIAADMGLGVGTVKTYRARAFERLDIHFKNELFALFLDH